MDSLVLGQITHRRTRSALTVIGVAIGVVLVTLTVGLAQGQLAERGRREAGTGADVLIRPGGSGISAIQATLSIDVSTIPDVETIDGVALVVPLGQHFERSKTGFGWRGIDGIDLSDYQRLSNLQIIQGRAFNNDDDEAIIDEEFARSQDGKIGSSIEVGGKQFKIVGIYSPPSMSRVKIPLRALQDYYSAHGSASMLMVKAKPGADLDKVALAIRNKFPDTQVILSRDLPAFYSKGIPALNTFLNVVVGLAMIVSTLVILLTMYTTVIERTRQIGILKSLGASRSYVAGIIESEAILISTVGVITGLLVSVGVAIALRRMTTLQIEFQTGWILTTSVVGILSGAIGALYPALRAARMDPVEALMYD